MDEVVLEFGVEGGVAGGVEGGIPGGVVGGIVGGLPADAPPPDRHLLHPHRPPWRAGWRRHRRTGPGQWPRRRGWRP